MGSLSLSAGVFNLVVVPSLFNYLIGRTTHTLLLLLWSLLLFLSLSLSLLATQRFRGHRLVVWITVVLAGVVVLLVDAAVLAVAVVVLLPLVSLLVLITNSCTEHAQYQVQYTPCVRCGQKK